MIEFHRLNLGFLACKGLRERGVYHRKLAEREYWSRRTRRVESDGRREGTDQRGTDEVDTDDGEWRNMHR